MKRNVEMTGRLVTLARSLNFWYLLFYFVVFSLFFVWMPKYVDDYWYMSGLRGWFEGQDVLNPDSGGNIFKAGIPWKELWETCRYHYLNDNCRISNMIVPFFLLFPKWVGSGISLLVWIYLVMAAFRMAGIDWRRSALVPLALLMFWYALPWIDHMSSMVYQFNYLLGAGLGVFVLCRLWQGEWRAGWYVVAGIVTGMWQEGVSFPILCGLVAAMFFDRNCRNMRILWLCVGLCMGIALLFLSPGLQMRFIGWGHRDVLSVFGWNRWGLVYCVWYVVYLSLVAVNFLITKKLATGVGRSVFMIVLIGASICVYFSFDMGPRIILIGNYFAVVGIVGELKRLLSGVNLNLHRTGVVVGACLMAFLATSQVLSCGIMFRMRDSMHQLYSDMAKSRSAVVFGETYPVRDFPVICMGIPDHTYYRAVGGYYFNYLYGDKSIPAFVPEELRDMDKNKGVALAGDCGARLVEGHIVLPADSLGMTGVDHVDIDYGKGYVFVPVIKTEFLSEGDGRRYLYLYPDANFYIRSFKTPVGVRAGR